jgi:hypothetical protein
VGKRYQPELPKDIPQDRELYQKLADEVMQRIAALTI